MKQNYILGTIQGYDVDKISLFVKSARFFNQKAKIVLFAESFPQETIEFAKKMQVDLQFAFFGMSRLDLLLRRKNWIFPIIWRAFPLDSLRTVLIARTTNIMIRRFAHYKQYLLLNYKSCENVLISDIRDVIFQNDFFSLQHSNGLHAFLEDESVIIGAPNDSNIKWLNDVNRLYAKSLAGNVSSCAGVIYGDKKNITCYLNKMLYLAGSNNAHRYGGDQAIHNFIVQKNLIKNINIHSNKSGPVFTMNDVKPDSIQKNQHGEVVNQNNQIYSLLHHYDRFPQILDFFQKKHT